MSRCKALVAAGIVSLATATMSPAALMPSDSLINFRKVSGGTGIYAGNTYNIMGHMDDNAATLSARVLKNRSGVDTDITASSPNFGGFASEKNGNGIDFTYNGFTFSGGGDNAPTNSYIADNMSTTANHIRDGLIVIRFTSDQQYHFDFTVVGSFHGGNADGAAPPSGMADGAETLVNIGGTYQLNRPQQKGSFDLGETVSFDPTGEGNVDRGGAVIDGDAVWDSTLQKYVLDLQFGVGNTGNLVAISALRLQTSAIPEPTVMAVLTVAGAGLMLRRRRA